MDKALILAWLAGPSQRVKFIESLTTIGITRADAFGVASGRNTLVLTPARAKRVREIMATNSIPSTSYSLTPA